jgi:hypothetical protein
VIAASDASKAVAHSWLCSPCGAAAALSVELLDILVPSIRVTLAAEGSSTQRWAGRASKAALLEASEQ